MAKQQPYKRAEMSTGGAFNATGDGKVRDNCNCCSSTRVYDTTLISAKSAPKNEGETNVSNANITVLYNLVLHVVSALVTIIAGGYGINKDATDDDYNKHLDDSVRSWSYVMVIGTSIALLFTVLYCALFLNPLARPWVNNFLLGLFFAVFSASIQLSYWVSTRQSQITLDTLTMNNATSIAGTHHRNTDGDEWIVLAPYLQAMVIASMIATPLSGLYNMIK